MSDAAMGEATEIAGSVVRIKDMLDDLRAKVLKIDNASAGSYRARCGLADAADSLEITLGGLIDGFKVKP